MILKINDRITNRKVDYFNQFKLNLQHASVASTFSFNFYFDPLNHDHKEMACVSHYHVATLEHNGELLLTGYILSQGFNHKNVKELVAIGGYSLPGFLEDCEIPTSLYPLQSDGLTLRQIAQKLIKPFGLKMVVDPSVASKMDSVYDTSTASETQTIKGYLTELAAQKHVLLSHDAKGNLVFTSAKTKQKPILEFKDGVIGTTMTLAFDGQRMHSHITVQKQSDLEGGNAGESTVTNPYVPFVYRPKVKTQSSGTDIDTDLAARQMLAEELRNLKLTIVTDRWEIDGKIIKPGNIISVINPEVYIYKKTLWFIESIEFIGDNKSVTATINCVLPEVYNGETPVSIFKGINLH